MKVTLLGTGLMGYPMAGRLIKSGHTLTVFNRTIEKAQPLKDEGAQIVASAKEAIDASECIILMLSDVVAVNDCLFSDDTCSYRDKTVIQMSTIAPSESLDVQEKILAKGGEYFECPVLGSIKETQEGTLILMVGSPKEQFTKWKDFLTCFGPDPKWIGQVPKAAALKLAMNQLIASLCSMFSLSLGFIQREGVGVEDFMDVLRQSSLYASAFDKKMPRMLERDYANPNFPSKHMLKDVELMLKAANSRGLSTDALDGVRQLLIKTVDKGLADGDYSALFDVVNPKDK